MEKITITTDTLYNFVENMMINHQEIELDYMYSYLTNDLQISEQIAEYILDKISGNNI